MQRVESSWVYAVDYRPQEQALYVTFHQRGIPYITCRYGNMDPTTGFAFLNAPSKGKFVHQRLMRWPYTVTYRAKR